MPCQRHDEKQGVRRAGVECWWHRCKRLFSLKGFPERKYAALVGFSPISRSRLVEVWCNKEMPGRQSSQLAGMFDRARLFLGMPNLWLTNKSNQRKKERLAVPMQVDPVSFKNQGPVSSKAAKVEKGRLCESDKEGCRVTGTGIKIVGAIRASESQTRVEKAQDFKCRTREPASKRTDWGKN